MTSSQSFVIWDVYQALIFVIHVSLLKAGILLQRCNPQTTSSS